MKYKRIKVDYSDRWPCKLQVGDVIARPNGPFRVVRAVRHSIRRKVKGIGTYEAVSVTLSILHCSWTNRCYTCYREHELLSLGYVPVGIRVELNSRLDKKIDYCITNSATENQVIDCCDVKGIT